MAATIVSICNIALSRMGKDTISSLTEASEEARQCSLHYYPTLDSVLREYNWPFATKVAQLATVSGAAIPGWDYVYAMPGDSLRIKKIYNASTIDNPDHDKFVVMLYTNQKVIATDTETAWAEYIADVRDPNLYDWQFIDAFAWRLASNLAHALTGNAQFVESSMKMYYTIAATAYALATTETRVAQPTVNKYLDSR